MPLPYIFGCQSTSLNTEERKFFIDTQPLGFILFKRNCVDKRQVKELVKKLRSCVKHWAPVLIDQEGGRVQRLNPPIWRSAPAAAIFEEIFQLNPKIAKELVFLNARLIAEELFELGIDVNCAPVVDLKEPNASFIIGDRAFSSDPEIASILGRSAIDGFENGGVAPILKHIPGHGRAEVDSHLVLPRISSEISALKKRDFKTFLALNDCKAAMTGHLLFSQIDPINPVTTSSIIINDLIRMYIDFQGLLLSDDLSMEALSGSLSQRATEALYAGCDIALHCNGRLDEMVEIASANLQFNKSSEIRIDTFLSQIKRLKKNRKNINYETAVLMFNEKLARARVDHG
jgi:beta-N-acetylhexosaminidase